MSIREFYSALVASPRRRSAARALQCIIALHVLYRLATEVRFGEYLWGPNGLGALYDSSGGAPLQFATYLHWVFGSEWHFHLFLAIHALAAIGLLAGVATRSCTFVLFLTVQLLQRRLPELADGGDNVMSLVTVYALGFMGPREQAAPGSLRIWIHNLAVSAVVAQTIIIYATAGFYKFMGPVWQNGTALYVIGQVDRFTIPAAARLLRNSVLCTLGTWGTLAYQAMFPVAIFSRVKKLWLFIGVSFHVGIIVMMGLVPFSLIMIGLDVMLLGDAEIADIVTSCRRLFERAVARVWPAPPARASVGEAG